jgi:CRISPR/Cas system CSM-associated protein Csm2 small subunit
MYAAQLRSTLGIEAGDEDPEALSAFISKMKSEDLTIRANAERSVSKFVHDVSANIQDVPSYDFNETSLAPVELKDIMDGLKSSISPDSNSEFPILLNVDEKEIAGKLFEEADYLDEEKHGNSNMTSSLGEVWSSHSLWRIANDLPGDNKAQNYEHVEEVYAKLAAEAPRYFNPRVTEDSAAGIRELLDKRYPGALDANDPLNQFIKAHNLLGMDGDSVPNSPDTTTVATSPNNTPETHEHKENDVSDEEKSFDAKEINVRHLNTVFNEVRSGIKSNEGWTENLKANSLRMLEYFLYGEKLRQVREDGQAKISLDKIWDEDFMEKFERKYGESIPYLREHLIGLLEKSYDKNYPRKG